MKKELEDRLRSLKEELLWEIEDLKQEVKTLAGRVQQIEWNHEEESGY